jgi:hypothetical protein
MFRLFALFLLLALPVEASAQGLGTTGGNIISPGISVYVSPQLGMQVINTSGAGATPWPTTLQIGGSRLWNTQDAATNRDDWKDIETARGVYSWTALDNVITAMQANLGTSAPLNFTFGDVPAWANASAGRDVLPTSYQDLYDFATAIVTHTAGKILYWEIWNEASITAWCQEPDTTQCTAAHMATISQNLYSIIKGIQPSAIVLCPSSTTSNGPAWFQGFLAAGGGAYCDQFAYHGYQWVASNQAGGITNGTNPLGEQVLDIFNQYSYAAQAAGYGSTVINDTERSWSVGSPQLQISSTTLQAANIAVVLLLEYAKVGLANWFGYDVISQNSGQLRNNATGALYPAGTAFKNVAFWLNRSTVTTPFARTAGTQLLTNTNATTGTTVGTLGGGSPTGTLPTGWSGQFTDAAHGMSFAVAATGTENGIPYFDLHVSGTYSGGGNGFAQIIFVYPYIAESAGTYLWLSAHIKLSAGTLANIPYASLNVSDESTSTGGYLDNNTVDYNAPNSLSLDKQVFSGAAVLQAGPYAAPFFQINYNTSVAVDATFRIGAPSLDTGSVWKGTILGWDGNSRDIAWATDNGSESFSTSYANYCDLSGVSHAVIANAVTLTSQPILLQASAACH